MFLQGVHLGAQLSKSHTNMKRYLLPKTGDVSFSVLNLHYTLIYFRLSFNLMQNIIAKRGVLLVVNESKLLMSTLKESWKHLNQPISFGEWSSGTLTNFRFILKKTLKTFFVKSRLAQKIKKLTQSNGKLSLKLNNKIRSKFNLNIFLSELRKRIRKLYTLPHVVFVTDTMLSSVVVREANIVKIPLIGIVDSTSNVLDVSYPIPGNSSSLKTLLFYYKLLKLVVLKGILQEKVNFLRVLSKKLNFELKTHQLIKTSKTKRAVPFKKVSSSVLDTFFFKKDLSDFFTNSKLFYLFYPNFHSKGFYKDLSLFHSFVKWHLYSFSKKQVLLNKGLLIKALKSFFLNQQFFCNNIVYKSLDKKTYSSSRLNLSKFLLVFTEKSFSLGQSVLKSSSVLNKIPDFVLFKDFYSTYYSLNFSKNSLLSYSNCFPLVKSTTAFQDLTKRFSFLNTLNILKMSYNSNIVRFPGDFSNMVFSNMLNYVSFFSKNFASSLILNNWYFKNKDFVLFYTFDLLKNYHLNDVFFSYHRMLKLHSKKKLHVILNDVSSVNTYLLVYKNLNNYLFTLKRLDVISYLTEASKDSIKIKQHFRSSGVFNKKKILYWNSFISTLTRNYKFFYNLKLSSLSNLSKFAVSKALLTNFSYATPSSTDFRFVSFLKKYQNLVCNVPVLHILNKGSYKKKNNRNFNDFSQQIPFSSFDINLIIKESLKSHVNKPIKKWSFNRYNDLKGDLSFSLTSFIKNAQKGSSSFYKLYGKII